MRLAHTRLFFMCTTATEGAQSRRKRTCNRAHYGGPRAQSALRVVLTENRYTLVDAGRYARLYYDQNTEQATSAVLSSVALYGVVKKFNPDPKLQKV